MGDMYEVVAAVEDVGRKVEAVEARCDAIESSLRDIAGSVRVLPILGGLIIAAILPWLFGGTSETAWYYPRRLQDGTRPLRVRAEVASQLVVVEAEGDAVRNLAGCRDPAACSCTVFDATHFACLDTQGAALVSSIADGDGGYVFQQLDVKTGQTTDRVYASGFWAWLRFGALQTVQTLQALVH